jgi:hypothetical protein
MAVDPGMSGQALRVATFNLESLDEHALTTRIAVLRPALVRLRADILCLQEVNGQRTGRVQQRRYRCSSAAVCAIAAPKPRLRFSEILVRAGEQLRLRRYCRSNFIALSTLLLCDSRC